MGIQIWVKDIVVGWFGDVGIGNCVLLDSDVQYGQPFCYLCCSLVKMFHTTFVVPSHSSIICLIVWLPIITLWCISWYSCIKHFSHHSVTIHCLQGGGGWNADTLSIGCSMILDWSGLFSLHSSVHLMFRSKFSFVNFRVSFQGRFSVILISIYHSYNIYVWISFYLRYFCYILGLGCYILENEDTYTAQFWEPKHRCRTLLFRK